MTHAKLPIRIGVFSASAAVGLGDLSPVCAAIQHSVNRDLYKAWGYRATVQAFPRHHVPRGYQRVSIQDEIDAPGAAGYHSDKHNQPFAVVSSDGEWGLTADHEIKEMIVDPHGSRLVPMTRAGKRVEALVEVCDPCESSSYPVDGIEVSDFVTPAYYEPEHGASGAFHSDLRPGQVAPGGYLSWLDGEEWYQETFFGPSPSVQVLGRLEEFAAPGDTPREAIDRAVAEARS